MISATSSLAANILTGVFGTPAASPVNIGTGGVSSTASSEDYILATSIGAGSSEAAFLSNVTFAQDTEVLLNDPKANGALTGKPSAYVQQIINTLAPGSAASTTAPSASSTTTASDSSGSSGSADSSGTSSDGTPTSTLPPDGLLA